jgi:radical SAM protein with 4Fe4S-binding SPASM domain
MAGTREAVGTASSAVGLGGSSTTYDLRVQREREQRGLRQGDVLEKRLVFESRPWEAHVGFSNYCNMSCIMCWDGDNPPLVKMSPAVARKLSEQVAPWLSAITPHSASEPLVLTWDLTREIAERHNIRLLLTTNVQFLDEQKFHELKDITEVLHLSIDSHIPEIFEKIRPGSRPAQVFENLERTARLCNEHGVECMAQAVFMTENAAMLPDTTAYIGDIGIPTMNIIPLIDVNGRSGMSDPMIHFSNQYIEHLKERCIEVARERKMRLLWLRRETHDFRPVKPEPDERSLAAARWEHHMSFYAPGYCRSAYGRLRIEPDGEVAPCCAAGVGELVLGHLDAEDFDEIWNGTNAQDLRRGMVTWDYPTRCSTCRFLDRVEPQPWLPFVEQIRLAHGWRSFEHPLPVYEPEHMTRTGEPPRIRLKAPRGRVRDWYLALALGGGLALNDSFLAVGRSEAPDLKVCRVQPSLSADGELSFELPEALWSRLQTNLGYWWTVFGVVEANPPWGIRTNEIRCLIRHEELPRVADSTLDYPDTDGAPVTDLGREKEIGWTEPGKLPERPKLGTRKVFLPSQRRITAAKREESLRRARARLGVSFSPAPVPPDEYLELVEQVRCVVQSAIPDDETVLVVSRGDERLLDLEGRHAWHFPRDEDGAFAGYHPRDSTSAMRHLEALRAEGAAYLVLPATAFWWLDHYRELVAYLVGRYEVVLEDPGACVIFSLRR